MRWLLLLANSLLTPGAEPVAIPFFALTPLFGWPVLALAIAAGMGRLRVSVSAGREGTFDLRSTPRVTIGEARVARGA